MSNKAKKIIELFGKKKYPGCRIFVLHANADKALGNSVIQELRKMGYLCWDSENCILPGRVHNTEQEKAISDADFVIVIFSEASTREEGRFNKLLRLATEYQEEKSEGGIKLISILVDKTDLPYEYRKYEPIDINDNENKKDVLSSIEHEFNRRKGKGIVQRKPDAIWL